MFRLPVAHGLIPARRSSPWNV